MILILGGTAEARQLADALVANGIAVTSSLAGRVTNPRLPRGEVRIGGFGGATGLVEWMRVHDVRCVVDATHPFAARISEHAAAACARTGTPLLALIRPGWSERPGDRWFWVGEPAAAAEAIPALGSRVLLTTGRQGLAAFAGLDQTWFLIRCVDRPEPPLPPRHELLLDRGPYTLAGELGLIDAHRIDLVVTKDSGGEHTVAKLDAARQRGLPVVIVRRPARPEAQRVATVAAALDWARFHAG